MNCINNQRPLDEADTQTQTTLRQNGRRARKGDQVKGFWICPASDWWKLTGTEESIYLEKGSQVNATWEFNGEQWTLAKVDIDKKILPPRSLLEELRAHWCGR